MIYGNTLLAKQYDFPEIEQFIESTIGNDAWLFDQIPISESSNIIILTEEGMKEKIKTACGKITEFIKTAITKIGDVIKGIISFAKTKSKEVSKKFITFIRKNAIAVIGKSQKITCDHIQYSSIIADIIDSITIDKDNANFMTTMKNAMSSIANKDYKSANNYASQINQNIYKMYPDVIMNIRGVPLMPTYIDYESSDRDFLNNFDSYLAAAQKNPLYVKQLDIPGPSKINEYIKFIEMDQNSFESNISKLTEIHDKAKKHFNSVLKLVSNLEKFAIFKTQEEQAIPKLMQVIRQYVYSVSLTLNKMIFTIKEFSKGQIWQYGQIRDLFGDAVKDINNEEGENK